jgi:hypothetical protein
MRDEKSLASEGGLYKSEEKWRASTLGNYRAG